MEAIATAHHKSPAPNASAPAKPTSKSPQQSSPAKPSNPSVTTAIAATVIIVLGLASLAVYAYLQTQK